MQIINCAKLNFVVISVDYILSIAEKLQTKNENLTSKVNVAGEKHK